MHRTLDVCSMSEADGGYTHDINSDPSGGWKTVNLCASDPLMMAEQVFRYGGRGNGVFLTVEDRPHNAEPDIAMLEACTISKWEKRVRRSKL